MFDAGYVHSSEAERQHGSFGTGVNNVTVRVGQGYNEANFGACAAPDEIAKQVLAL